MDSHGKLFNRIAFFYQLRTPFQIRKYRNHFQNHEIRKKIPPKGRILDIGAGTGAFGYIFKELGYDVVCIDVAPNMIKMCEKNGLNGMVYDVVEGGFPFPDNSFELVIAAQFLHGIHSDKRRKLYEESKRVSSKRTMILYDYNVLKKNRPKARLYEWIEGGFYQDFRDNALIELENNFEYVEMFELNRNNAYYLCS
jgi:putative AdoMet-dependent methyltransferase